MAWHKNAIFELVQVPWGSLGWWIRGKHEAFNISHLSIRSLINMCMNSAINSTIYCLQDSRTRALRCNSGLDEWNEKWAVKEVHPAPLLPAAAVQESCCIYLCWWHRQPAGSQYGKSLTVFWSLVFRLLWPSIYECCQNIASQLSTNTRNIISSSALTILPCLPLTVLKSILGEVAILGSISMRGHRPESHRRLQSRQNHILGSFYSQYLSHNCVLSDHVRNRGKSPKALWTET